MKPFLAELRDLSGVYDRLEREFDRLDAFPETETEACVAAILEITELLGHVSEMDGRLQELAAAWPGAGARLDARSRTEVEDAAGALRQRALALSGRCARRMARLQAALSRIGESLAQLRQGGRYLEMLRSARPTHSKYVNSHS
jgi:hypothetical protein